MRLYTTLVAVVSATALLATLVSTASARNFSTTSQGLRSTFREVRFRLPFGEVNCQVTLEGTLHARTMAKVAGSLIGYITRAELGPCSVGAYTILRETLPWHIRYLGFTGTLPTITSIRHNVIGWSERMREPGGATCLWRSTATEPVIITYNREAGGTLTTSELGGTIRTGAECFGTAGTYTSDRGPATVLGGTARVTVTLI